jgi:energy-coupling factor transporter ATP-binding protein EcfA2
VLFRSEPRLTIRNFAQIEKVDLTFGDLTVLIGAQGTGKSLALQWLKLAVDGGQIASVLRGAGYVTYPSLSLDVYFGEGMGTAWSEASRVLWNGKRIRGTLLERARGARGEMLFIPAHRATLISDGWALPFHQLSSEVPVVARLFSDALYQLFSSRSSKRLFPHPQVRTEARKLIDDAIFHGAKVGIERSSLGRKRLRLQVGEAQLPFMTWTAGQREFAPLLLGLYGALENDELFPRGWVVIEEPEMGLHPQAITAFLVLVLDLMKRGYRVVLSTHSPHVITAIWMLRRLAELGARPQLLCDAFEVPSRTFRPVAVHALAASYRVHLLEFVGDKVRAKDISSLDPASDDEDVAGWGGLAGFSERFSAAVRRAANEAR